MSTHRIHSLDALRAFALLLGVFFHSALAHVLPAGLWAVGTNSPSHFLGWFVFYTHSFRMGLFFLLAGFFGAMVVEKRGLVPFVKDRLRRIVLVFVVLLYPMKFALAALWMIAGRRDGWLPLPPEAASTPWWQLAWGALDAEALPGIQLTHLWFLYYLAVITALFLAARALVRRVAGTGATTRWAGRMRPRLLSVWPLTIALACVATPIIAFMQGPGVDTPDQSLALSLPVIALYGLMFATGSALFSNQDLLEKFARNWPWLLGLGLVASLPGAISTALQWGSLASGIPPAPALKWTSSALVSLTMMFSVFGWLGLFVRYFAQPSAWIRYLADASYWIYLAHLPLVVALQIAFAPWNAPWWIQWPLVNLLAFPLLLASYHWLARRTWIGSWLNGRKAD